MPFHGFVRGLAYGLLSSSPAGIKFINISSNDIVDGSPKLTLGLVWALILHYQVKVSRCTIELIG